MQTKKFRISISIAIILTMLFSMSGLASAAIAGFGGGGGNNPLNPVGFAYVTNRTDPTQYQYLADPYTQLDAAETLLAPLDPAGNPWTFLFFVERNPNVAGNDQFIRLDKNEGILSSFADIQIGQSNRIDGLGGTWAAYYRFPVYMNAALDPGCVYEFKVLRGMTGNNGVSAVVYVDELGTELGYLKTPLTAEEQIQYDDKKLDVYQVRDGSGNYSDFIFRFRTEADPTPFLNALSAAQAALTAAQGNVGTLPGQFLPEVVNNFESAIQGYAAYTDNDNADLKALLQTEVQELAGQLDDLVSDFAGLVNPQVSPTPTPSVTPSPSPTVTPVPTTAETTAATTAPDPDDIPQTGETDSTSGVIIGITLLASAVALIVWRKRSKRFDA